jgi:hypothetical protein
MLRLWSGLVPVLDLSQCLYAGGWQLGLDSPQNVIALSTVRGLAGIGFAIGSPCGSAIIGTHLPRGKLRGMAFAAMAGCKSYLERNAHGSWGNRCWNWMDPGGHFRRPWTVGHLTEPC